MSSELNELSVHRSYERLEALSCPSSTREISHPQEGSLNQRCQLPVGSSQLVVGSRTRGPLTLIQECIQRNYIAKAIVTSVRIPIRYPRGAETKLAFVTNFV